MRVRVRDLVRIKSGKMLAALIILAASGAWAASLKTDDSSTQWRKGLVRWRDAWQTPEQVAQAQSSGDLLKQYQTKRNDAPKTVEGQLQLANWCQQHHLADQERVHLTQLLAIDASQVEAHHRLGHTFVDGIWMNRDEIRRAEQRAKDTGAALTRWSRQLDSIAAGLNSSGEKKQAAAKAKLMEIRDPNAIPAMELVLGRSEKSSFALIEALAASKSPSASLALARLSLDSASSDVRAAALAQLKMRKQEDYVPALLGELTTPLQTTLSLYFTPDGRLTYRHWFYSEGEQLRKLTAVDQTYRSIDGGTLKNPAELAQHETELALAATQQGLATEANNDRICKLLSKATGLDFPAKPDIWWSWWIDKTETYFAEEKPIYRQYDTREYALAANPRFYGGINTAPPPPPPPPPPPLPPRHSCLAAGTMVWTLTGKVAIEKVQMGDLVLAQNIETGELAYKPVLKTTVRPPVPLVRFNVAGETINATGGHLFWEAGKGWIRARQFTPGVALYTLQSPADIVSVSETPEEKAYNLIVADFHSYFVGDAKLLSHDNTMLEPTEVSDPGVMVEKVVRTTSTP